ncbi:MAG: threonine synthase, partial [Mariprofundus sp.]|nr:threonine synthase [Mariprofundus sp.]
MYNTLIISQALIQHQDGVSLHPELFLWDKQLSSYRRRWFHCAAKNPLGWYAALCDSSPAALLAQHCDALPEDVSQYWVASPYHAQLVRTAVHVMPEAQLNWTAEDADYLCATLNPLLAEEGMQLFAVGAALLLACREPIAAYPQGFGVISGQLLPDTSHEGEDGLRLNRLLSEI